MKYEYTTTFGDLYKAAHFDRFLQDDVVEQLPSDPVVPSGDGWEIGFGKS